MPCIALSSLCVSANFDDNPKSGVYQSGQKLSSQITKRAWSPIIFKNGVRRQTHFQYSDWAVLDFDAGTTIDEAIETFQDCVYIIGTTKSHTEKSHRFRVCVPWERRITSIDEFRHNQKRIVQNYDGDVMCVDGARFYYPCTKIVDVSTQGHRMEVEKCPATSNKVQSKTGFSSTVTFFMKNVIDVGKRNFHIGIVSKDLFRIGLDKQCVRSIILNSPTYRQGEIPPNILASIDRGINGAWRAVQSENQG